MNLQDYNKWAEWDYRMEHPECETRPARFPWYFKLTCLVGCVALWATCRFVETVEWLRKSDPAEILAVLWVIVCAGLFIAGMIIAILS